MDELSEKYAIVIVTHSMQQAARVSQRVAYFHLGSLIAALATEVLLFGGLFVGYWYLRASKPELFEYGSHFLNTTMGAILALEKPFGTFKTLYETADREVRFQRTFELSTHRSIDDYDVATRQFFVQPFRSETSWHCHDDSTVSFLRDKAWRSRSRKHAVQHLLLSNSVNVGKAMSRNCCCHSRRKKS